MHDLEPFLCIEIIRTLFHIVRNTQHESDLRNTIVIGKLTLTAQEASSSRGMPSHPARLFLSMYPNIFSTSLTEICALKTISLLVCVGRVVEVRLALPTRKIGGLTSSYGIQPVALSSK